MKSEKIILSLIAGLILLQPQTVWPTICQQSEQKTSWLSRHKGKIIGATLLIAGFYCGVKITNKVHALLPTPEEMKKMEEAADKVVKTAAVQLPRLNKHLNGASSELQGIILNDFDANGAKMLEIIAREKAGESCRADRVALWLTKRKDFAFYGAKKLWDKATNKD